jgi:hypothetical protein
MQWKQGEWRCSSTILDLGTRWRWVLSFTSWPLYPQRLDVPQSSSEYCVAEKDLAHTGIGIRAVQPRARRYPDSWLLYVPPDLLFENCVCPTHCYVFVSYGSGFRPLTPSATLPYPAQNIVLHNKLSRITMKYDAAFSNCFWLWLYSRLFDLGSFFRFLTFYTVGRAPWTGDQPVARPLSTHRTTQTQTSMPRVGFESTTPAFERTKAGHGLDCAATVIGYNYIRLIIIISRHGGGLRGWTTGVRFLLRQEIFLVVTVFRPSLGPSRLLSNGCRELFPRV